MVWWWWWWSRGSAGKGAGKGARRPRHGGGEPPPPPPLRAVLVDAAFLSSFSVVRSTWCGVGRGYRWLEMRRGAFIQSHSMTTHIIAEILADCFVAGPFRNGRIISARQTKQTKQNKRCVQSLACRLAALSFLFCLFAWLPVFSLVGLAAVPSYFCSASASCALLFLLIYLRTS